MRISFPDPRAIQPRHSSAVNSYSMRASGRCAYNSRRFKAEVRCPRHAGKSPQKFNCLHNNLLHVPLHFSVGLPLGLGRLFFLCFLWLFFFRFQVSCKSMAFPKRCYHSLLQVVREGKRIRPACWHVSRKTNPLEKVFSLAGIVRINYFTPHVRVSYVELPYRHSSFNAFQYNAVVLALQLSAHYFHFFSLRHNAHSIVVTRVGRFCSHYALQLSLRNFFRNNARMNRNVPAQHIVDYSRKRCRVSAHAFVHVKVGGSADAPVHIKGKDGPRCVQVSLRRVVCVKASRQVCSAVSGYEQRISPGVSRH